MTAKAPASSGGAKRRGKRKPSVPGAKAQRAAARLAAVQALYQIDLTEGSAEAVLREFVDHRLDSFMSLGTEVGRDELGDDADEDPDAPPRPDPTQMPLANPDRGFFVDIVRGTTGDPGIDPMIDGALSKGWTVERLERILRAVLRAGVYELLARRDVPTEVVISQYVDVAHAFFAGREPALVNGVLDKLAKRLREDEVPQENAAPLEDDASPEDDAPLEDDGERKVPNEATSEPIPTEPPIPEKAD